MVKQKKIQNTNEEKNLQGGCFDFSSEEINEMFKLNRINLTQMLKIGFC